MRPNPCRLAGRRRGAADVRRCRSRALRFEEAGQGSPQDGRRRQWRGEPRGDAGVAWWPKQRKKAKALLEKVADERKGFQNPILDAE
jgi:hypothetical protein